MSDAVVDSNGLYFKMRSWKQFGRCFRNIRMSLHLRLIDVARAGHVSMFTLIKIENGEIWSDQFTLPLSKLFNLCQAIFSIPVIEGVDWDDEMPFAEIFRRQGKISLFSVKPIKR